MATTTNTERLRAAAPRMADAIRAAAQATLVCQLEHSGMVMMPRALYDELENALNAATAEYEAAS